MSPWHYLTKMFLCIVGTAMVPPYEKVIAKKISDLEVSAGSGLVVAGGQHVHIVADDENHIFSFSLNDPSNGKWTRIFPGDLPSNTKARKKVKKDIEASALIPPFSKWNHGALVAFPSGSKENRHRGALVALDAAGQLLENGVIELNFNALYLAAAEMLGSHLNIEGATVVGNVLRLFQRGNGQDGVNATFDLDLSGFLRVLEGDGVLTGDLILSMRKYEIGSLDGVPLSFSDAATLGDGKVVFSASAETGKDTYMDGSVAGSVIGVMSADGDILKTYALDARIKVEGVWAIQPDASGEVTVYLVTDADDAEVRAELYLVKLAPKPVVK